MSVDAPGRMIAGKYELVAEAGSGGMAVVWKALARGAGSFARTVAIKRIQNAKHADPSFIRMFEEEARVGSELHHPNVVQILDFGMDDQGGYYLVMEWVEGLDMFQWMRSFPRGMKETPWALVAAIGIEVCRGLSAAHERVTAAGELMPVYHRDVSPSNVLLGTSGIVKLTDFGLARAMDRASMTRPNVIKGKLAYCAPELISGAKPSPQSDLFALSVVLWEALAQRRLFTGKNDLEVLLAVRKGDIPRLDTLRTDLPSSLVLAIHQGLESDPAQRYENAKSMARALASVLRSEAEHVDAEPLGASVRAARKRMGRDPAEPRPQEEARPQDVPRQEALPPSGGPQPRIAAPVVPRVDKSAEEISLSELEDDADPIPLTPAAAPQATDPKATPVTASATRGLWTTSPDDPSAAAAPVPLVHKKR